MIYTEKYRDLNSKDLNEYRMIFTKIPRTRIIALTYLHIIFGNSIPCFKYVQPNRDNNCGVINKRIINRSNKTCDKKHRTAFMYTSMYRVD